MPYVCCVPYCHGNYNIKNKISVFKFPTNEDMKEKWIKAIPRSNYSVNFNSRVCENHFRPEEVKRETSFLDEKTGNIITAKLHRPFLETTAIPSIFPSCTGKPSWKNRLPRKSKLKQSQHREESLEDPDIYENPDMLKNHLSNKTAPATYSKVSGAEVVNMAKKRTPRKVLSEFHLGISSDVDVPAVDLQESEVKTTRKKSQRLIRKALKKVKLQKLRRSSQLTGRRIVDISYFIQQIKEISDHGYASCSFKDMVCVSEHRRGFRSSIKFRCQLCFLTKSIWTNSNEDSEEQTAVNAAAITGIKRINGGHSKLKTFTDALSIPCLNREAYTRELELMEKSAKAKKQITLEKGKVNTKGSPTSEEDDGSWTKIDRKNFNSFSGADLEKPDEVDLKPCFVNELEPNTLLRPVTESDFIVELDSETLITPDIDPPDFSEPGLSSQAEHYPIKMEQDIDQALTCDIYLADAPAKIKEEPIDPDEYQDVATVAQRQNSFSNETFLTSNQAGSLFHLPVLIKEEPVCFEEES